VDHDFAELAPLPCILHHTPTVSITITAHNGFYNHFPTLAAAPVAYCLFCRLVITGATPLFGRRIEPPLPLTVLTIHILWHFVRYPG